MRASSTITMASLLTLLSANPVRAFAGRAIGRTSVSSFIASTTSSSSSTRLMASQMGGQPGGPFPMDDARMPFYALGTNLAMQVGGQNNLKTILAEEELEIVLHAFCETLRGTSSREPRDILGTYGPQLNKLLQERTANIMDRVKQDGEAFTKYFLDCNPEATKSASGLVYCEMTPGTGQQPALASTVEVHYHGTLTDGTVFDSSVERGQTISFPLGGVIKGWQEGLQLMKEGGKAMLVIPSELGYGDSGSGETIPPGATLRFEVELFKVS